jgi:FkbM family methyltransferase
MHPCTTVGVLLLLLLSVTPSNGSARGLSLRGNECGTFHSQYSQDEYLERNYFKGKKHGVYVDLGAYNPTELSNTAYFDKCRGWSGLCVDANPTRAALFEGQRSCKFIHACLTDPAVKKAIIRDMDSEDYLGSGHTVVPCLPVTQILKENGISHIDYLSIDVEGHEWQVIRQLNFTQISVKVISVETWHGNRTAIRDYLEDAGFVHAAELGADDIYYWHGAPWLPAGNKRLRADVRNAKLHKEF